MADQARTENLVVRETETRMEKVRRVAKWRGVPYAELIRPRVDEIVEEHDRLVEDVKSEAQAS